MMTDAEALVSSTMVLGSTGTAVSGVAVVLWKKHRGERLPRWFRVIASTLSAAAFIYALSCLISAAHPYYRHPLISHTTEIIGFPIILAVTLCWVSASAVLADGHWPPSPTCISVTAASAGIGATNLVFLLLSDLNLWLAVVASLILQTVIGGIVRQGWVILLAPMVTTIVLFLFWFWDALAADIKIGVWVSSVYFWPE